MGKASTKDLESVKGEIGRLGRRDEVDWLKFKDDKVAIKLETHDSRLERLGLENEKVKSRLDELGDPNKDQRGLALG